MKLVFSLFKYFPFGGLQRDFFRIAEACAARGHEVHVLTRHWEGDMPEWLNVHLLPVKAWTNSGKNKAFYRLAKKKIAELNPDLVIGFNKMPGLDVYFSADPCFQAKADESGKGFFYRCTPRYRHFVDHEAQLFRSPNTKFFVLTDRQREDYQRYYDTPDQQFYKLPPGIARDRVATEDSSEVRREFREEHGVLPDHNVLLLLGSGFKTKGLDRAICALAQLPENLRQKTSLFVVGKDNPASFEKQAELLGIRDQVHFFAGRDDVPRFLQGTDLLIHPARSEAAGMVLLEAIVAGLPVLVTEVCGFAHYISTADAGVIHAEPFNQRAFSGQLQAMLESRGEREKWSENGVRFSSQADIFELPVRAAEYIEQFHAEKTSQG